MDCSISLPDPRHVEADKQPPSTFSSSEVEGQLLDSQLVALGHVGLIKHHREAVKQELSHQRQVSSAYRKLAFRLAAQVSARDERLYQQQKALANSRRSEYLRDRKKDDMIGHLWSTIRTWESQGEALLHSLKEDQSGQCHLTSYIAELSLFFRPFNSPAPQHAAYISTISPCLQISFARLS
jgi:hypothetical protein